MSTNPGYSSDPTDFKRFYENGQIPQCELKSPPGLGYVTLHPQAAEQLGKLMAAARAAGFPFRIISSYRTYESQLQLVGGDPDNVVRGVAKAGTSKHGWGTAIDIGELWDASVSVAQRFATSARPLGAGNPSWDKFDGEVHAYIRQTNALYQWLDRNAPLYGWVNPDWARNGGDYDECWHWEYRVFSNDWPQRLPANIPAANAPVTKAISAPCGPTSRRTYYSRTPIGTSPRGTGVSQYIGSLDSFHPKIQYELTKRRIGKQSANTYMPFVRLTSLLNVYKRDTVEGTDNSEGQTLSAYCPSIGVHGENSVDFNEIYYPRDNRSIVGYALREENESIIRTPLVVRRSDAIKEPQNIPMPGIVDMSVDRSTAGPMGVRGGLVRADIKILAYSVGQLNTLITYFLRPATRVVLEIGRMSSDPNETIKTYPWTTPPPSEYSRSHVNFLQEEFTALVFNPEAQKQFIKDYIYDNYGNYEIFIGYVVKFDIKYNKDNVYEISLTVHSVQQFEIPTVHSGVRANCPASNDKCRAMDVREYFDPANSWKPNTLSRLMTSIESSVVASAGTSGQAGQAIPTPINWNDHFIAIRNSTPSDTGAGSRAAGTDESEYFVSWRFFVEKILRDRELGLISVIPDDVVQPAAPAPVGASGTSGTAGAAGTVAPNQITVRDMLALGLLRDVDVSPSQTNPSDLLANEVGYHPSLRSIDASVMIIYNKQAQQNRSSDELKAYTDLINAAYGDADARSRFNDTSYLESFISGSANGDFRNTSAGASPNEAGTAFLDNGVWLNTRAIREAFSSADTVTAGINNLLSKMNAATQGYWNLQLYSTDRFNSGLFVIDMGLSKKKPDTSGRSPQQQEEARGPLIDKEEDEAGLMLNSVSDITPLRYNRVYISGGTILFSDKPKYLYMFNRGLKRLKNDNESLGSELIDLNVEFNLPQVIAVQAIAGVGGPAQKSTLQSIDIDELQKLNLIPNLFANCPAEDVCKEEDCSSRDDLSSLQANWQRATGTFTERTNAVQSLQTLIKQKEAERDAITDPTDPRLRQLQTELTELQTRLIEAETQASQAKTEDESAKNAYNAALVQRSYGNTMVISTAQELGSLGTALQFVEFNAASMMKKLNIDSTTEGNFRVPPAHNFNSSNLTKTTVSLTMPGIGGIDLFQSFAVDRVPSILDKGFYVVTKVAHKFTTQNGWVTTIEGRFRFRPLQESTGSEPKAPCERVDPPPTPPVATAPVTRTPPQSQRRAARQAPTAPAGPVVNWTTATDSQLLEQRRVRVAQYRELKQNTYSIVYRQSTPAIRKVTDDAMIKLTLELTAINNEIEKRIVAIITRNGLGNNVVPPPFTGYNRVNPVADWLMWTPNAR